MESESVFGKEMEGRLVIRGGFGMAYNAQEQAITLNGWPNVPFTIGSTQLSGSNMVYDFPNNPNSSTLSIQPQRNSHVQFGELAGEQPRLWV